MEESMSIVDEARAFATEAHRGQVRKYTGDPYIVHPQAVVATLEPLGFRPEVLAAAWLHDVVEDCGVESVTILNRFGADVQRMVYHLTDVSIGVKGSREVRKALDRAHNALGDSDTQSIKLADLIDNSVSIMRHDPSFARVYMPEKAKVLEVLTLGHPVLRERASAILHDYEAARLPAPWRSGQ
jgi:(p)ppGpp synthase/HD superfamily hydrolase